MNEKKQDLLDGYLNDELSEREKIEFNSLYRDDEKFRKQVDETVLIIEGARRNTNKQEILKNKKITRRNRFLFKGSLAVLFILLLLWLASSMQEPLNEQQKVINKPSSKSNTIPQNENIDKVAIAKRKRWNDETKSKPTDQYNFVKKKLARTRGEYPKPSLNPIQSFLIHTKKDQQIRGDQGTELFFKANSFETKEDFIQILLQEYYSIKDMLFADLCTVTKNGELLRTGGMIYLNAMDSLGNSIELKEDKSIQMNFSSFPEKESEMGIYFGTDSSNTVFWEKSKENANNRDTTMFEFIKTIHGGVYYKLVDKQPSISKTKSLESLLNERLFFKNKWKKHGPINIDVMYSVHKLGFVSSGRIIGESPSWADSLVENLFLSLPFFEEVGEFKGEIVSVRMVHKMSLNPNKGPFLEEKNWNKFYEEMIVPRKDEIKNAIKEEKVQFLNNSMKMIEEGKDENSKYSYSSNRMGWINLDAPCYNNTKTISLLLPDSLSDSKVRLIEPKRKVIIAPVLKDNQLLFEKLPEGIELYLFVHKLVEGKNEYAWKKWTISKTFPSISYTKNLNTEGIEE